MKDIKVKGLISLIRYTRNKKICIFDNNTVNFLYNVENYVLTDKILNKYDILLIPNWVYEEVKDSQERLGYLKELMNKNIKVFVIDEFEYEYLTDFRSEWIYKFFLYSCHKIASLKSFLKRRVEKNLPLTELDDYEEWLKLFYEEGFERKILKNGRIQKKNAGEISICVLALIISYIYNDNKHSITILSNDRDTYDFINAAKDRLINDKLLKSYEHSSITFKSNDFIIKEVYLNKYFKGNSNLDLMLHLRDEKRTKYTIEALDKSIEEHDEVIHNNQFKNNLENTSFNIIF